MFRLVWQLLGMLGNVLGLLGMLRNVLGMLCNVLGMLGNVIGLLGMLCNVLGMLGNVLGLLGMPFRKVLGVPHQRKTPPLVALQIFCKIICISSIILILNYKNLNLNN